MTTPDLSWLGKTPRHTCDGRCGHTTGIETERKVRPESPVVPSMGNSGMVPRGADQTIQPFFQTDPICADCDEPLSGHSSPILRDGVIVGYAHPENSCRRFVEK